MASIDNKWNTKYEHLIRIGIHYFKTTRSLASSKPKNYILSYIILQNSWGTINSKSNSAIVNEKQNIIQQLFNTKLANDVHHYKIII